MKKFLVGLCVLMVSASVFAVDFGLGGKLALNINGAFVDKDFKDAMKASASVGVGVGVFATFGFTDMFAIQPEIAFDFLDGIKSKRKDADGDMTITLSATTLNIPILAKIQFAAGTGKLGINLGPQFTFVLGKIKMTTKGDGVDRSGSAPASDLGLKSFLVGFAAGLDYALPIGPGDLVIDVRYAMDFMQWGKKIDEENYAPATRFKITPSVGYKVNL